MRKNRLFGIVALAAIGFILIGCGNGAGGPNNQETVIRDTEHPYLRFQVTQLTVDGQIVHGARVMGFRNDRARPNVTIPAEIRSLPVLAVHNDAFRNSVLTSINFVEATSMAEINARAFQGIESLQVFYPIAASGASVSVIWDPFIHMTAFEEDVNMIAVNINLVASALQNRIQEAWDLIMSVIVSTDAAAGDLPNDIEWVTQAEMDAIVLARNDALEVLGFIGSTQAQIDMAELDLRIAVLRFESQIAERNGP